MAWPVEPNLLTELEQKCIGFSTGVHFASFPGICSSGALLSNAQLPSDTLRPSQAHDSNKTARGHNSIYFRFVQRPRHINENYKKAIVSSLRSVGSSSGLLFYVDFNEAYNHLEFDFANPMDCIGGLANKGPSTQFQSIIAKLHYSPELAEIAFKTRVPFSCVKYIGVNFGPSGATLPPPYLSSHQYAAWTKIISPAQAAAAGKGIDSGLHKPSQQQWIHLICQLFQFYRHSFVALDGMVTDRAENRWKLFFNTAYTDAPPQPISFFPPLIASPARPSQPSVAAAPTTANAQSHLPPLHRRIRRP